MAFSTYNPLAVYPADGSQTDFDAPDLFYDEEDVRCVVVIDGIETTAVRGVDFDVVVIGRESTPPYRQSGLLRFIVAPVDGASVVPYLLPASNQDQKFEGRPVTPREHERVHDRAVMTSAMLIEFFNRGFRTPLDAPPSLRFIANGAEGHVPKWDANGNLVQGPTIGEISQVAGIADEIAIVAGMQTQVNAVAVNAVDISAVAASLPILVNTAAVLAAVVRIDVDQSLSPEQQEQARNNLGLTEGGDPASSVPPGVVWAFAGDTAPSGWSECDGDELSRATDAALFGVIGVTYGEGNGSTTFNKPDLRGEFIRGWDHGRGVDDGRTLGSAQGDQNKAHTHTGEADSAGAHTHDGTTQSAGGHSHTASTSSAGAHTHSTTAVGPGSVVIVVSGSGGTSAAGPSPLGSSSDGAHTHTVTVAAVAGHTHSFTTGSGGAHTHTLTIDESGGDEARPRNVAMMYIIKL